MPEHSILLSTGQLSLGLSRCGPISPHRTEEEIESQFILVFPLAGVFGVDWEGWGTSATPSKAIMFSMGQTRRVDHPHGGHDRSAFISMDPQFAEAFLNGSGEFRVAAANTSPGLDYRLRRLIAAARIGCVSSLEVEEFTTGAMEELTRGDAVAPPDARRAVISEAETYLSVHFRESCDLSTLARAVGYSPHHLSRLFKQVTGETVSRRRTRLRLASAISEILDGADDLSRVAVDSGFYDHSHMTVAFRSHLGIRPNEVRSSAKSDFSSSRQVSRAGPIGSQR
ncbi:MAG TPA: AraC family transcriptional regulator [Acidimicrobiia bacterium]